MNSKLLRNIYNNSTKSLSIEISNREFYDLNCFVKSETIGGYPLRIFFEHIWHNIGQNGVSILKNNTKALFCFHDEIIYISDIFLDSSYQNKGIVKSIILSIKSIIKTEHKRVKYISLKSLSSGIVAWYKMGFEFYQLKDKMKVQELLEDYLIDVKRINESDIDSFLNLKTIDIKYLKDNSIDFDQYLNSNNIDLIPMLMEIKHEN